MKMATVRARREPAMDFWGCAAGRERLARSRSRSQPAPRSRWEQFTADLIETGQREHGLCPRQVLSQAAVAHLGEAPQLLDHAEGVLAVGADARACPIDHAANARLLGVGRWDAD